MAKIFDVIVVGSGIAGLSFALKVAQQGKSVAIITKKNQAESNTNYAQGGIAAVMSKQDDFDLHVQDTLEAGDGLCVEAVVRKVVEDAPERIQELIAFGVAFSTLEDGRVSLGKEGGHSKRRILHVKDLTGAAIEEALVKTIAANDKIAVLEHHFAIDLITEQKVVGTVATNRVLGLYALDIVQGTVETFQAPVIMLATGGVGQVYQYTTNPSIATGDGIAMAYRAGAEIRNMEFIQFHPTALYSKRDERFLISEAVRGEGAILRNAQKEAFMQRYHERADLAPRDVVARAIDVEMKTSGAEHLWLDITGRSEQELVDRFPTIYEACKRNGINMANDMIPIVPACHYLCGGIATNLQAETNLAGLLACGEVACTGLHGANRLASNSLLEACVLAHHGAEFAIQYLQRIPQVELTLPEWVDGEMQDSDERVVLSHNWDELKRTLWDYVGIVRSNKRLQRAGTRIRTLKKEINDYYWNFKVEPKLLELRNMIQVAELIIECALIRKESRGLHYTLDYLHKLEQAQDSVIFVPGANQ